MKTVIFLTDHIYTENLLSDIRESFDVKALAEAFRQAKIELRFATFHHYDKYLRVFTESIVWSARDTSFEISRENIVPNLIWLNTKNGLEHIYDLIEGDYPILPKRKSAQYLCDNYSLYLSTAKYQKPAVLLEKFISEERVKEGMANKIVIKPIRGTDESGVDVMEKEAFLETLVDMTGYNLDYLFLVQENINSDYDYDGYRDAIVDLAINVEIVNGKIEMGAITAGNNPRSLQREEIPRALYEMHEGIIKDIPSLQGESFLMQFGYCKIEERWYFIDVDYITPDNYELGPRYTLEKVKLIAESFKAKFSVENN